MGVPELLGDLANGEPPLLDSRHSPLELEVAHDFVPGGVLRRQPTAQRARRRPQELGGGLLTGQAVHEPGLEDLAEAARKSAAGISPSAPSAGGVEMETGRDSSGTGMATASSGQPHSLETPGSRRVAATHQRVHCWSAVGAT